MYAGGYDCCCINDNEEQEVPLKGFLSASSCRGPVRLLRGGGNIECGPSHSDTSRDDGAAIFVLTLGGEGPGRPYRGP